MAIIVQPNYDTRISSSVGTPNVIDEGEDVPYKRLARIGEQMQEAGAKLYANAKDQARTTQLRDAKEKYNIALTQTATRAAIEVDNDTGKMGKEPNAPMMSDFMAKKADSFSDEIAFNHVDEEYREDFRNLIASEKQAAKTQSIVHQSTLITRSSPIRIDKSIEASKSGLAVYNTPGSNVVNEAMKQSDKLLLMVEDENRNGNLISADFDEKMFKVKEDMTDPLSLIIVEKQNDDELIDMLSADFFESKENKDRYAQEKDAKTEWAMAYGTLREKAGMALKDPGYHFRQKQISKSLFMSAEKKQALFIAYSKQMSARTKKSYEEMPNLIGDIVTKYSNPQSSYEEIKKADVTVQTGIANLKRGGEPAFKVLDFEMKANMAKYLGKQLKTNPYLTASSRDAMADKATASVLSAFAKRPEYAQFMKEAPVFGASIRQDAVQILDRHNEELDKKFQEDPATFFYNYHNDVKSAWNKVFNQPFSKVNIDTARTLTEQKWKTFSEGRGIKLEDMQYRIIPNELSKSQDLKLENALYAGEYEVVRALLGDQDSKGIRSQISHSAVRNKTPMASLQNATQYMTPEFATQVSVNWKEREMRKTRMYAEFKDNEDRTDFNAALDTFVKQNTKKLSIPGQENQSMAYAQDLKETILSEYSASLLRDSGEAGKMGPNKKTFATFASQMLQKMYTDIPVKFEGKATIFGQASNSMVLTFPNKFVPPEKREKAAMNVQGYHKNLLTNLHKDMVIAPDSATGKAFNDIVVNKGWTNLPAEQKTQNVIQYYVDRQWFQYRLNLADETLDPVILINGKQPAGVRFKKDSSRLYLKDVSK